MIVVPSAPRTVQPSSVGACLPTDAAAPVIGRFVCLAGGDDGIDLLAHRGEIDRGMVRPNGRDEIDNGTDTA